MANRNVPPFHKSPQQASIFQAMIELADVAILVLDDDDNVEFANSMTATMLGYAPTFLEGKKFTDLFDAHNRRIFKSLKQKCNNHATRLCQVMEIKTLGAQTVTAEMCLGLHAAPDSETNRCFVYLRDISLQKKLTEELRESEMKYRDLFERADQGISISTKQGRFIDCNPALLNILGYDSKTEFLKIDITKDLYADPAERRQFQELIEKNGYVKNYEAVFKRKNGDCIPILLTAHARRDNQGTVVGYQGLIIDISERISIEQALKEKHSYLTNLLESSVDCIVAADIKGHITFFNKAAEKLTGYKSEDVIGKLRITQLYPLDVAKLIMQKLISDEYGGPGRLENFRLSVISKDGDDIPVNLSASIVYEDTKPIATLGIFYDLREKIKMEKELQQVQVRLLQAEKMASLGSLAAGVAHEINNPLGGILIYASLLKEEFEESHDPRTRDLQRIVEEATRCKEIVKSLLEFGRQTETRFESVDINRAILDGLFFLEHQVIFHDIEIIKHLDFSVPPIQGNPNQLKQVFMNMMVNAAEAMSDGGGTLTISTGHDIKKSTVTISFQDTGTGIPQEIQSMIFDPFFTTKDVGKGTGLGLSTSYGIVQSHHGSITVDSPEGRGVIFTITLPLTIDEKAKP